MSFAIKPISVPKLKYLSSLTHCTKVYQKPSPPLTKKSDRKLLTESESQSEEIDLPKSDKVQKSIFGATILPQNLSFENSKKLTENQVKLKDIPVVDEHDFAEELFEQRMKGKRANTGDVSRTSKDDLETIVADNKPIKKPNSSKKSFGELLCSADSFEDIPGPSIFRNILRSLKLSLRQFTISSLFQWKKFNVLLLFKTYGPIVRLPETLGGKIVLVTRPEHIYSIFEQDQRYPINSMLDSIQRSRLQQLKKNEIKKYHLSETDWEYLRESIKNPVMRRSEDYFERIEETSRKFIRRIKTIKNRQGEVPDDFLQELNKWSLECLCEIFFESSYGFLDCENSTWSKKTSQLLYSLSVATKSLKKLETGFQLWRFINTSSLSSLGSACDVLENCISEYVAQVQLDLVRKKENSGDSCLTNLSLVESLLLQNAQSPDDIVSNILDSLIIGTNTMSVALGFLLYHISQNPRVQLDLWKEIKQVLPEKYNRLEYSQLKSLKLLHACLKESLRLKMPIPLLTRVLSKNILLGNYQIPKGSFIMMMPQIESLKEENFTDAKEFFPERWIDQDFVHPYTSLPIRHYFVNSFERRMAEVAVCVCAASIIRNFSVEYLYDEMEATNSIPSYPNKPLKFTFEERQ